MCEAGTSGHELVRQTRCVLVSCGSSEGATRSKLDGLGCGVGVKFGVPQSTELRMWDADSFRKRLKEAHVPTLPYFAVVGVTGNVHWPGMQPLHDADAFSDVLMHRLHRVTGAPDPFVTKIKAKAAKAMMTPSPKSAQTRRIVTQAAHVLDELGDDLATMPSAETGLSPRPTSPRPMSAGRQHPQGEPPRSILKTSGSFDGRGSGDKRKTSNNKRRIVLFR